MIRQRKSGDCGIAALANFAELSYEDVYVVVAKIDPAYRGGHGLYNRDIIEASRALGIPLTPTRKYDLDDDEGVLRVSFKGGPHFVCVKHGIIFCPTDGMAYPWREYLERYKASPMTLLKGIA